MKIINGCEIYCDSCYYYTWAVRKVGERNFNKTNHFYTEKDANEFVHGIKS